MKKIIIHYQRLANASRFFLTDFFEFLLFFRPIYRNCFLIYAKAQKDCIEHRPVFKKNRTVWELQAATIIPGAAVQFFYLLSYG